MRSSGMHDQRGAAHRRKPRFVAMSIVTASCALVSAASAQPAGRPAGPQPARPETARASVPAGGAPVPPEMAAATNIADLTTPVPGGVTAEQVGLRAMQTSFVVKASLQTAASQEGRVEAARANWYPRLGLTARYTRLSVFTPPSLTGGSGDETPRPQGSLVGTPAPDGTLNPSPTVAVDPSSAFGNFRIPLVFNQYLLQATLAVPISDYFLRIGKAYSAATQAQEAARYDVIAAKARSYSDGKVAYFTWMRARGAITVAQQSLVVARAHQKDAENQFAVGNASKADVLRAQTQVAAAELAVERAKNGAALAERQVRVAMHLAEGAKLEPGDALDANLTPVPPDLRGLVTEAASLRAEIKSIDRNAEALKKSATVQRNGQYPQLSAFGDLTYANPNPRRFPQTQDWFPTWAVGAQVTWTPTDYLTSSAGANELEARANAAEAQRMATRDGIELEVTQAYQDLLTADAAIQSTTRQLESAVEGYRVARELFNNGRGTGTTLIDAETALAQTRFEYLNARVDARIARVRLEHAIGRDTRAVAPTGP